MPTPLKILVALLLPLAAVLLLVLLWPSGPERQIRKALERVAETVEKSGAESQFEAIGTARRVAEHFTDDCSVEYRPGRVARGDRREIAGAALKARESLTELAVTIESHTVELGPTDDRARSTARVRVRATGAGQIEGGRDRYRIDWVRIDGDWLISRVEILEE